MIAGWCALMRTCLLASCDLTWTPAITFVFPKTTSPTYFSFASSFEIVSRLHVALPVGEAMPCIGNFPETVAVHEVVEDKKYNVGFRRIDHKFSGARDLVTIANSWGFGRGPALKAPLQSSPNLLTLCHFHGNIFLPKFQLQDNRRRHSPKGCAKSHEDIHLVGSSSLPTCIFDDWAMSVSKIKVDKPLQIGTFKPLGLSTYHVSCWQKRCGCRFLIPKHSTVDSRD